LPRQSEALLSLSLQKIQNVKWDNSPAQMGQTPSSGTWKNNYPQKETNPEQDTAKCLQILTDTY